MRTRPSTVPFACALLLAAASARAQAPRRIPLTSLPANDGAAMARDPGAPHGAEAMPFGPYTPLQVEASSSRALAVVPEDAALPDPRAVRYLCQTPCALGVWPGVYRLLALDAQGLQSMHRVEVPRGGLRVRLRFFDPERQRVGIFLAATGVLGLSAGPPLVYLGFASGSRERVALVALGAGLLVVGVVGAIVGLGVGASAREGAETLGAPARWARVRVSPSVLAGDAWGGGLVLRF